jgi:predicted transcriptional regulator
MPRSGSRTVSEGLAGLRRSGSVTEILFLYECTTLEPTQLRPIADSLGLTVQAASHTFRALVRRGLVEQRGGRYRPTVRGVAWLHDSLGRLSDDVRDRIQRLHVIRTTHAVALGPVAVGDLVSLELVDGLLSARSDARGPSRGRVSRGGAKGALVEVTDLEGIVPLVPAPVHVRTLSDEDLRDGRLGERLRRSLGRDGPGLVATYGLAAFHAVRSALDREPARFAVAAEAREASRVGVSSTIFVQETELPRLLTEFEAPEPPPFEVSPLARGRAR